MTLQEDHSEDTALAGEYALHLLDADERHAFERRLEGEPQLRQLVVAWDEGFALLSEEFEPVTPPAGIKTKIDNVLFPIAKKQTSSVWGWLSGLGLVAVLAVFAFFAVPYLNPPASPLYSAELAAEDETLVVVASYFPENGRIQIDRQTGSAASGRALELWLIADGASVPVSLGVLSTQTTSNIEIPQALIALIAGGTLAISDEPLGGSTTGAPTGAVLAAGVVTEI